MTDHRNDPELARRGLPHDVLREYYPTESRRRAFLDRIFDETAGDYDRIEKLIGFGSGSWYRRQALLRAGLAPGMTMIDVGIGTGLVAREAATILGDASRITGVDPSAGMMGNARLPEGVRLLQGKAEAIPLPDACADFLTLGFALRHIGSLPAAFSEFHRVLRPGGTVLILELTRPGSRPAQWALKAYMRGIVPAIARITSRNGNTPVIWRYYWDTIEACIAPPEVMAMLGQAGFTAVDRHVEIGIFSEYTGRRR